MELAFDPGQPDGHNASLTSAISPDGTPKHEVKYRIPPRCGVAVRLDVGDQLFIENTHGTQVCDFWAFSAGDFGEYLSMEHLHTAINTIYPRQGHDFITNRRRAIFRFMVDTSPGRHDTVIAACDHYRYRQLGCTVYHDNCTDNLRMALIAIGARVPAIPAPLNLWMNTPVAEDGSIQWLPPLSSPGDTVTLRAEMACMAVMSACPQDLTPINGLGGKPTELHFWVHQS